MNELINDVNRLKQLVDSVEEEELVSVHFFSEAFDFVHKIQEDLIRLESVQIEKLRKDIEIRQSSLAGMKNSLLFVDEERNLTVASAGPLSVDTKNESKTVEKEKTTSIPIATDSTLEITQTESPMANSNFSQNTAHDIRTLLSLNDRFRFQRELFDSEAENFNHTLDILNTKHSYGEAIEYIRENLKWDEENETVIEFETLLDRYFSRLNEKL